MVMKLYPEFEPAIQFVETVGEVEYAKLMEIHSAWKTGELTGTGTYYGHQSWDVDASRWPSYLKDGDMFLGEATGVTYVYVASANTFCPVSNGGYRGEYSAHEKYIVGQLVTDTDGRLYGCVGANMQLQAGQDITGYSIGCPLDNTTYWALLSIGSDNLAQQKLQDRSLLKRSCAEAGLNLVDGSFEEGASVTLKTQVVWQQATGKIFGWFQDGVKTISAGTTPETTGGIGTGAWVDRTDVTLMSELSANTGAALVGKSSGGTVQDLINQSELVTHTAASIPSLPHGYRVDINGQVVESDSNGYGGALNHLSVLSHHIGMLNQSHSREYANSEDQVVYTDNFSDLSGWVGSSGTVLQVSGGKVYGNGAGANSGMNHGISEFATKFRCVTTIDYVTSVEDYGVAVGINSASVGSAPAGALSDAFAIYFYTDRVKYILDGAVYFADNTTPLVSGKYIITISADDNYLSITAKLENDAINQEYHIRISRVAKSANNIVIFNSDTRLLSGSAIGPLAVGVNSTASLVKTGIVDSAYKTVVWTGGANADYRIVVPSGYDSRKPRPAVILFHGLGSTERTWATNANYHAIQKALTDAGFIVISGARRNEYGTWGNANAQAAYSETYRYLLANYSVSCIACLANSMGGVEFFNTLSSELVGIPTCLVATSATANLAACYASSSLTSSIKTAYGIASDGSDYATKTDGFDPILERPDSFFGLPQLWICADDDATVSTTLNRNQMTNLSGVSANKITHANVATGGHEFDITPYLSQITQFIYSHSA